jgi:Family of unknown function (DUF5372)
MLPPRCWAWGEEEAARAVRAGAALTHGVSIRGRRRTRLDPDRRREVLVATTLWRAAAPGHGACSRPSAWLGRVPRPRPTSAASPSRRCSTGPSRPTCRRSSRGRPGRTARAAGRRSCGASSRRTSSVAGSSTGRSSHTRYDHFFPPTPPHVTITRRHHPLQGHTFEVVRGGPRELVIRTVDGVVMRVPRAWTDADGETSTAAGPDAVFTVEAIRVLVALVEALRGPWKH